MEKNKLKLYSFFLPQFHECPFNNEWWGKGFTEWENVKNSIPRFEHHIQPNIPLNGYYDLGKVDTLKEQFENANLHGIDGFIIYHYWYEGKMPLSKVIETLLLNPEIKGNFSLCWANHSWTRSWTNRMGAFDTLIEQTYEKSSIERNNHFQFLNRVFSDKRCIKVDGKPLFQIYRPESIPNLKEFIFELRKFSLEHFNHDLHISALVTGWQYNWEYLSLFDSATFFQPSLALFSPENIFVNKKFWNIRADFFIRALPDVYKKYLYKIQDKFFNSLTFFDYDKIWQKLIRQYLNTNGCNIRIFPSAFVDFDNSPRYKKRAKIIKGFSLGKFEIYLNELIKQSNKVQNDEKIVFINAWNEWGEGMYLEGDVKYKNQRLEIIKKIMEKYTVHNES